MRFEGEFKVPGPPGVVIQHFADTRRMARCMPGADLDEVDEEGFHPGRLTVSFGPKKLVLRGRVRNTVTPEELRGHIEGRGTAEARSAKVRINMAYTLHAMESDNATDWTRVVFISDAELQGVLADFAKTGGVPVVKALLDEFSRRIAADMSAGQAPGPSEPVPENNAALSAPRLFWLVIAGAWRRAVRWFKKGAPSV